MLIDTNTLLRTVQPAHPQRETARIAIKALTARGRELHLVPQNLMELWVGGHQADCPKRPRLVGRGGNLGTDTPQEHVSYVARQAGNLSDLGKTGYSKSGRRQAAHDARLVAAMLVHGLTVILTFDRTGFSRYPGIEVVHPADVAA